ncbi:polysaccharide deacetylase family protein [Sutcliffiella rhizosphaerae]|nr:polysaccharide deacetylase family protein [Sutcliffiella rhizosphaerae]
MRNKSTFILFVFLFIFGCSNQTVPSITNDIQNHAESEDEGTDSESVIENDKVDEPLEEVIEKLQAKAIEVKEQNYEKHSQFSEYVPGVKTRLDTDDKVVALTLDACGGENGSGYDKELIDFLIENNIKADLFINARWIHKNENIFLELAKNPLFTIQNHGTEHKPLSVTPNSAWGIESTSSQEEIVQEIMDNQFLIYELTGELPRYFRSGTAFYDEVSVNIANDLGVEIVNFDVIGDGGATFTKEQVVTSMNTAEAGSIIILHMNQPKSDTAEGVMEAVLKLKDEGYRFVHLSEYDLH